MSVDAATVRRIAHLARIAVAEDEIEHLRGELNAILAFVEQLREVDVSGVEPMTSVTPMAMKKREDVVTDGEIAEQIVQNAPQTDDNYFLVPKGIEQMCIACEVDVWIVQAEALEERQRADLICDAPANDGGEQPKPTGERRD